MEPSHHFLLHKANNSSTPLLLQYRESEKLPTYVVVVGGYACGVRSRDKGEEKEKRAAVSLEGVMMSIKKEEGKRKGG